MKIRTLLIWAVTVLAILTLIFFQSIVSFFTDLWWFGETGYADIFIKSFTVRLAVGLGTGIFAFVFLFLNFTIASHSKIPWMVLIPPSLTGKAITLNDRAIKLISILLSLILAFMIGLVVSSYWMDILKYFSAIPFNKKDPIFGMDIGFYIFSLPVYTLILGLIKFLFSIAIAGCLMIYVARGKFNILSLLNSFKLNLKYKSQINTDFSARMHLGILIFLYILSLSAGTYLSLFSTLFNQGSAMFGSTFADVNFLIPIQQAEAIMLIITAITALIYAISGRLIPFISAVFITILISAAAFIVPGVVQKFIVAPNELVKETPYIKNNIKETREAYGLDKVEKKEIVTGDKLTSEDIENNDLTIKNVRLWDRDPLLSTFSQIQEIRTYYEFESVDNDRYKIDGEIRQIMLSPRELAAASLPNRNWINEHLTFTHGYGLTAGPVNLVTPEGLPVLFVRDIPPKFDIKELEVKKPQIYFGEMANDFIIVNSRSKEFDYPKGDANVYTQYNGKGGVQLDSLIKKLFYTLRFNSLKIFLSGDVTSSSKILYNRQVKERAEKIAPFLKFDRDPYMVIADGKLFWILDAYTTTDLYPYSQKSTLYGNEINYIRNSVKSVIDAYDGSINFYIADPNDTIIRTYAKIFPGVFRPMSEIPEGLISHIRYPEDLFTLQTAIYTTYHMDDPQIFYNKEDLWEIPSIAQEQQQADSATDETSMAPRHLIMKLPGEQKEEYVFMLPFTPRAKDNLAAWMAARNDDKNYGKLVVYSFPKDKLVFGPKQVMGRINQDPEVSRQISLWDQRGSQVIQGPLLVIPIEDSLVYVRPLYLKSETGKIPELKRVIAAYDNKIAMEETLEKALTKIFGSSGGEANTALPVKNSSAEQPSPETKTEKADILLQAKNAYDAALNAQRSGDWSKYGEEINKLGSILDELNN